MLVLAGLIDVKVFIHTQKIGVGLLLANILLVKSYYVHEVLILPHQQFHNQADNSV